MGIETLLRGITGFESTIARTAIAAIAYTTLMYGCGDECSDQNWADDTADGIDRAAASPTVLLSPVGIITASTITDSESGTCNPPGQGKKNRRRSDAQAPRQMQDAGMYDAGLQADAGVDYGADTSVDAYVADAVPDMGVDIAIDMMPDADLNLYCDNSEPCEDGMSPSCAYNAITRELYSSCCFDPTQAQDLDLGRGNITEIQDVYCMDPTQTRPSTDERL